MEAQFNSVSLKVFNQALASISRFGEKLFILPTHDDHGCPEVRLSVLNSSRTGFCSVYFREDFFESLTCAVGQDVIEASINIKALQSIVKNTRSSNKNVEACELSFIEEGIEDLLSIRLHCQHGVTKTHKLPYEPKIQSLPNGPPEDSPNHLIMSPNCARNWTDHFLGPKSGEISLWVTDQTCVVRSSEDIPPLNPTKASKDSTGNRMQITTEIVVSISDFEEYNIGQETRLTFNLKEFKSMTLLSEQLNCSLELIFTVGNEPIHIFLRKEKVVLVNTTLATHANDSPIIAANGVKPESKNAVGGAGGAIVASGNSIVNGLKVNGSGTSSRDRQSSAASSSAVRQSSNEVEDRDGERSASPQRSRPKARPIGKTMAQDDFASGSNSASNSQPTPSASASKGGKGPRSAPLPMESTPKDGASNQRSVTPRGSSREGPLFFPSASQQSNQDQDLDLDLEMGDDGVDFGADDDDFNAVEAEIASGVLEVRGSQSQAFRNKLNSSQHQKKVANEGESQPTQSEAGEGSLEIRTNSDRKGRSVEPISSTPRIPKPKSSSSDQVQSKPNSPVRQKESSNRRAGPSDGVQISQPGSIPSQSQEAFDYDERDHRRAREKERKRVEREERKKQKEAQLQERQSEEENEEVAQRQNEGVAQDPIQAESSSPRSRKSSSVAPAARNGRPMTSTASSKIPSSLIMDTIHPTPVSQGGDSLEVAAYQEGIETDGEGFEDELGETERSQEDSEAIRQVYAADQGQTNPTNLNVNQFTPRNIESYERELASSSLARQERLSGEMQEVRRLERINNNQGAEIGGGLEESNLGGIDEEVERGLEDDDEADELPPSQPRTSSLVDSDNENPNKKKKRRVQSFKPKF